MIQNSKSLRNCLVKSQPPTACPKLQCSSYRHLCYKHIFVGYPSRYILDDTIMYAVDFLILQDAFCTHCSVPCFCHSTSILVTPYEYTKSYLGLSSGFIVWFCSFNCWVFLLLIMFSFYKDVAVKILTCVLVFTFPSTFLVYHFYLLFQALASR